jgi:hypothetical protein
VRWRGKYDSHGWLIGALLSNLCDDKTVAKMGTHLFVAGCGEQATATIKADPPPTAKDDN